MPFLSRGIHQVFKSGLVCDVDHGPLTRYVKLRVAHASGTFSRPQRVSDPDMGHGSCVTHVQWCMPGLLISGFLWSRRWEKRSRHSQRMRILQFFVTGKRLISDIWLTCLCNCCDWLFYFVENKEIKCMDITEQIFLKIPYIKRTYVNIDIKNDFRYLGNIARLRTPRLLKIYTILRVCHANLTGPLY